MATLQELGSFHCLRSQGDPSFEGHVAHSTSGGLLVLKVCVDQGQSAEVGRVILDSSSCLLSPPFSHLFSDVMYASSSLALACADDQRK